MAFTCRLSDQAMAELEKIKSGRKIKTNSKALEHVLKNFRAQELQVQLLDGELRRLKRVIANKTEADREYDNVAAGIEPERKHPFPRLVSL